MNLKEFFESQSPVEADFDSEPNLDELTGDELAARDRQDAIAEKVAMQYRLFMDAALLVSGFSRNKDYGTFVSTDGTKLDDEYHRIEQIILTAGQVDAEGNVKLQFPLI